MHGRWAKFPHFLLCSCQPIGKSELQDPQVRNVAPVPFRLFRFWVFLLLYILLPCPIAVLGKIFTHSHAYLCRGNVQTCVDCCINPTQAPERQTGKFHYDKATLPMSHWDDAAVAHSIQSPSIPRLVREDVSQTSVGPSPRILPFPLLGTSIDPPQKKHAPKSENCCQSRSRGTKLLRNYCPRAALMHSFEHKGRRHTASTERWFQHMQIRTISKNAEIL